MKTVGFIGGGRITRILLNGFKNAGVKFGNISVYETNETVLTALKTDYPQVGISATDFSMAASSDWVFIALHPPVLMDTLEKIKGSLRKDALVISLAPKITLSRMEPVIPHVQNIARMNPNAGTYVNKGYNPVCFAEKTDKVMIDDFISIFSKLGQVPVARENQIEAYAMVSAMGHTYFWYQLQQLRELAISYGLSGSETDETLSAMMSGTCETLFNSGLDYQELVDLVPVKPMAGYEDTIREYYRTSLNSLYEKIKP